MRSSILCSTLAALCFLLVIPSAAKSHSLYEPFALCSVQPCARVGYFFPNKNASLSFDTTNGSQLLIQDFSLSINIQGVFTEVAAPIVGYGPAGLLLGFRYVAPSDQSSPEVYELGSQGYGQRDWSSSSQLWNLQAALTYNLLDSTTAMVGFRYDSLLTNLQNAVADVQSGASSSSLFRPGDEANLSYSGYIPFLGLEVARSVGYGVGIRTCVLGFPAVPGSFSYVESVGNGGAAVNGNVQRMNVNNNFASGYFLEALLEIVLPLYGSQIGAFVEYSGVYAKTTADVTSNVGIPGLLTTNVKSYHNDVNVHFQRSSWVVGGSLRLSFMFP